MPRVARRTVQSLPNVSDRPTRLKLLLRRQRRLLRPLGWSVCAACAVGGVGLLFHFARGPAISSAKVSGAEPLSGLRDDLGRLSDALGMRVHDVVIEGRANTPETLLRAALGVSPGDPLLGFSVAAARARIESLSWVKNASVERRMPGTIVVQLTERRPFAIWQNQGKFLLIDRNGQVVANQDVAAFHNLPLVVGAGAPEAAAGLLDSLQTVPDVQTHVVAAVRVGERRWNLHMKNGTNVLLPEGHEKEAIARLSDLQKQHDLLDRPLQAVDMRLPDRLVLRPRSEATTDSPAPHAVRRQT